MPLKQLAFLLLLLASAPSHGLVSITEILRDPVGKSTDCPGDACLEFVEFMNLGTDSLPLAELILSSGTATDSIIHWEHSSTNVPNCRFIATSLEPGGCAVILDQKYFDAPETSRFTFADSTLLLTVNHTSILGKITSSRGLVIYKGTRSAAAETLAVAADMPIVPGSALVLNSPPGEREGVSIEPVHVALGSKAFHAADSLSPGWLPAIRERFLVEHSLSAQEDAAAQCSIAVLRTDGGNLSGTDWKIVGNTGIVLASGTLTGPSNTARLAVSLQLDSQAIAFSLTTPKGEIRWPLDISSVWLPDTTLCINEIYPRASADIPEWIELTNASEITVNIKGWRFGPPDNPDTLARSDRYVEPGGFLVLTRDAAAFSRAYPFCTSVVQPTHWPSLDNYRDTIGLWNPLGSTPSDLTYYDHTWFDSWESGSLERVSFDVEGTSRNAWAVAARPTPCMPNASVSWRATEKPSMHIGPIPFTPNGDGQDDLLRIALALPAGTTAEISIYAFDGRTIVNLPRPLSEEFYWDGRADNGALAIVGPFFVVAEFDNGSSITRVRKQGVLWR